MESTYNCVKENYELPLEEDTKMMCDTFARVHLEETSEMPPFFPMEQRDFGFGDKLSESPTCDTEEQIIATEEIYQNDSKPICSKEQIDLYALFGGDNDGDSLLHISILHEHESIMCQIIQLAPDFTYLCHANDVGRTALHLAVLTGKSRIVRRLVCAGATVDAQDIFGNSPLHLACALGFSDVVAYLLKPVEYKETLLNNYKIPFQGKPLIINSRNVDGFTCLHLAIRYGHIDVLRLLLEERIDACLEHYDESWRHTAFHLAVATGNEEVVSLLIENNIDLDLPVDVTNFALEREHEDTIHLKFKEGSCY